MMENNIGNGGKRLVAQYVISNVSPVSGKKLSSVNIDSIGRPCNILQEKKGLPGLFNIEFEGDEGYFHLVRTSPIKRVVIDEEGTHIVETQNTVYTIRREPSGRHSAIGKDTSYYMSSWYGDRA